MITVTYKYICPTCNKELREDEMCAIVGHTVKSCKYCHTDIQRFIKEINNEGRVYSYEKEQNTEKD